MNPRTVRVGIVGAGNCASSFVQGLAYYRDAREGEEIPGLMNATVGRYRVRDIEIASAFDVNAGKVGRDLADALRSPPNNTRIFADPGPTGVVVQRGPTLDGIHGEAEESSLPAIDVTEELRRSGTDILVSWLPPGSQRATEWYALRALEAGCAFVNCIPVPIASDIGWRRRFEQARLPLLGDDIKSQVGATIVHRMLANLMRERGVTLDRTYQIDVGGNADHRNMLEHECSGQPCSTRAAANQAGMATRNIRVDPTDHVAWLTDRRCAYIRLEGTAFGGSPLNIELKLEAWDSPNMAGVVIDAVRCAKLALDRGLGGAIVGPSGYFMKSPPQQFSDAVARELTLEFIQSRPADRKLAAARNRGAERSLPDHDYAIHAGAARIVRAD